MIQKFQVIVADPAWSFKDSLKMSDVARGAAANYKLMTISDIKQLPIKDYADPNGSVLALWVPSSLLQEGLDTMKAWGFKHKQTYVWVKTKKESLGTLRKAFTKAVKNALKAGNYDAFQFPDIRDLFIKSASLFSLTDMLSFGMGRLFRQTHEICLIGTNNNKIYKSLANKSQRSVSFGENLKHSSKPEHLQDSLEIMFPKGKKLEMFARRHRPGWTCIGNEICNDEDITVSLAKLI
jgi:N6-adenosine-specific RNA methylase IME4